MTEDMNPGARELDERRSGSDEIVLLWYPESERVEVSVRDIETGAEFHLEVPPESAMDAFHHPYAYAALDLEPTLPAVMTVDDGQR
jgi:hypothetical protein